ncbi:hypothetical protein BHM03_00024389 [Ensete ventricosum]|nr:hypothetical protein BHM03_00024389 [Ensete ventricosum]
MGRGDRRGAQGADTAGRSVCSLRSSKIDGDGGRWEDRGGPEPSQGVAGGAVVRAGPAHERPSKSGVPFVFSVYFVRPFDDLSSLPSIGRGGIAGGVSRSGRSFVLASAGWWERRSVLRWVGGGEICRIPYCFTRVKDSSKSLLSFIISVVDSGLTFLFLAPADVLVWFLGFIEVHFFGLSHVLQDKFA